MNLGIVSGRPGVVAQAAPDPLLAALPGIQQTIADRLAARTAAEERKRRDTLDRLSMASHLATLASQGVQPGQAPAELTPGGRTVVDRLAINAATAAPAAGAAPLSPVAGFGFGAVGAATQAAGDVMRGYAPEAAPRSTADRLAARLPAAAGAAGAGLLGPAAALPLAVAPELDATASRLLARPRPGPSDALVARLAADRGAAMREAELGTAMAGPLAAVNTERYRQLVPGPDGFFLDSEQTPEARKRREEAAASERRAAVLRELGLPATDAAALSGVDGLEPWVADRAIGARTTREKEAANRRTHGALRAAFPEIVGEYVPGADYAAEALRLQAAAGEEDALIAAGIDPKDARARAFFDQDPAESRTRSAQLQLARQREQRETREAAVRERREGARPVPLTAQQRAGVASRAHAILQQFKTPEAALAAVRDRIGNNSAEWTAEEAAVVEALAREAERVRRGATSRTRSGAGQAAGTSSLFGASK